MKKRAMTILYEVNNSLYINLTNRCPCACTFCLRQTRDKMEDSDCLWLDHTPTLKEVMEAFGKFDVEKYNEIVFCGFGEPTEALEVLIATARYIKEQYQKPIRINTNGLGNLVNGMEITPLFEGIIDTVSVSLNTPDPEKYFSLVRPKFGRKSFDEMLSFAKESKKYVQNVVMTTVATTLSKEEEEQCAKICQDIGVTYRIRPWED